MPAVPDRSVGVADAKTPGRTYCLLGRCHRVLTLAEMRRRVGRTDRVRASFYDDCRRDRFNPCRLTSSGEVFRPQAPDNAASPIYPDGTVLLAFNPETGSADVLRINNAGPYHLRRRLDVSAATADALGFRAAGVADLEVRVIAVPTPEDAQHRALRRYWPVHGPIGRHPSIDAAYDALVRVAGAQDMPWAARDVDRPRAVAPAMPPSETVAASTGDAIMPVGATALSLAPLGASTDPVPHLLAVAGPLEEISAVVAAPTLVAMGLAIELPSPAAAVSGVVVPDRPTRGVAERPSPLDGWPPAAARLLRPPSDTRVTAQLAVPAPMWPPAIARSSVEQAVASASTAASSQGVFGGLRARARRGAKPGRLPDLLPLLSLAGVAAAADWAGEVATRFASRARIAARGGRSGGPPQPPASRRSGLDVLTLTRR